jgi:hypothetical protein
MLIYIIIRSFEHTVILLSGIFLALFQKKVL